MKARGGDKQGRGRFAAPQPESSQLMFRRAAVILGCFLFVLVLLVSSRRDVAVVFDTLSPTTSLRAPTVADETLRSSPGHEVRDTTPAAETKGVVRNEAEPELSNGAASVSGSDDRTPQGNAVRVTTAALDGQDDTETTTTSPPPRDTGADSADRQRRQQLCDFSGPRSDVCDLAGDIRLVANASTFIVVLIHPASGGNGPTNAYKVRPYPRKGDATAMGRVAELTVRTATESESETPRCTATHAAPAVVFSVSGYAGNVFHDFTDVIVPLYAAARRYRGDVQLVVTDAAGAGSRWLARYGALLRGLSRHAPLDLAKAGAAEEVHCFRRAVVGLRGHRELLLIVEQGERDPDGPTMPGFGRFLRRALLLPRDAPTLPGGDDSTDRKKPRLLIISRRGTRRLLNSDAVARSAEDLGFEAVVHELDPTHDVAQVGRLFNSFDAVVAVHGAGLTNMVFLPPGATVVQIVPWGGLRWIARLDFGDAAEAMGFRYIQYEVAVEESTLKDKYPRDHEVFTNPTALHRKGFTFLRHTFLNGQDIIVDVERFRPVLLQALNNLAQ